MCSCFKDKCLWRRFTQTYPLPKETGVNRRIVKEAGDELRQAYQILSQADEEDLVDYAVFTVKAAEKRYGYLLKKLKEQEKKESFGAEGGEI